ncbi:MAG: Hsp20/alpha crystallin family protein [Planctomycetota bacterium]|nr:Hsp20/alpha crystallin family protein [Planctomycetota bacterium]
MLSRRLAGADPFTQMQREMDQLFTGFFGAAPRNGAGAYPALNVWEDAERFYVEAELPGMKLEDIEVFVQQNELTLKGERKHALAEGTTEHRRERGAGAFHRTLALPAEVEAAQAEATLKDGVLTIALPKLAAVKPRRIDVRVVE